MSRVSLIIVNWNGKEMLADCLDSLGGQSYRDFETIVVDNGSTDGSPEMLRRRADVKVVALRENRGFAGGNVAGLGAAEGDLVALLNNDTLPDRDWLKELVGAMEADDKVGTCASKLVRHDRTDILDTAGDGCVTSGKGIKIGHGEPSSGYREKRYVFGACAGAALYRRKMIEDVGFLDEDFFLDCEDTDLNFRSQLLGWKCVFVPTAVVRHRVGASVSRIGGRVVYYLSRNDEYVWVKNMPALLMLRYWHHKVIQELAAFAYFGLKKGQWAAFLKGKLDALRALPVLIRKRKGIQRGRRVSLAYLRSILTPLFRASLVKAKLKRIFE
ncbi:MAG: glycosyltransferase family 2 protein [Planctomycetes bacterium]|nr:glycosyltransferase family 2 protein [Planctomycetota bacterium]